MPYTLSTEASSWDGNKHILDPVIEAIRRAETEIAPLIHVKPRNLIARLFSTGQREERLREAFLNAFTNLVFEAADDVEEALMELRELAKIDLQPKDRPVVQHYLATAQEMFFDGRTLKPLEEFPNPRQLRQAFACDFN